MRIAAGHLQAGMRVPFTEVMRVFNDPRGELRRSGNRNYYGQLCEIERVAPRFGYHRSHTFFGLVTPNDNLFSCCARNDSLLSDVELPS